MMLSTGRLTLFVSVGLVLCARQVVVEASDDTSSKDFWTQWMVNAQHDGAPAAVGQKFDRILADIIYDFTVPQEELAAGGEDLLVHYQVPLIGSDNSVYMSFKNGTIDELTGIFKTLQWGQNGFRWKKGKLVQTWSFLSDWKAPGSYGDFWEPVFHAALRKGVVLVPGAYGSIFQLNGRTGAVLKRISPFGNDPNSYQTGPITVDAYGNIFYNVVQVVDNTANGGSFYDNDAIDSFLVKVDSNCRISKVSYKTLTYPEAPIATAPCVVGFNPRVDPLPWPPNTTTAPNTAPCGTQRVGLNIAPAVAKDGTVYSVTRPHFVSRGGFLVAISPDLTKKWVSSFNERFNDGCGVPPSQGGTLPPNGQIGGCRAGANYGVDPSTNRPPSAFVLDSSSSVPAIGPDGAIYYGAYTRYNYAQGHMMKFDKTGKFLKAYQFGWDETPAIVKGDRSKSCNSYTENGCYSLVIKDNHYSVGSYCNDPTFCGSDRTTDNPNSPEQYFITKLDQDLNVQWKFQSAQTASCARAPNGTVSCVNDHPNGFEWCVNGHSVDQAGVVYANSEDGFLYAIYPNGTLARSIFQQLALGAAYTPTSMGPDGKIYSQNAGHLFVVGDGKMRGNYDD